MLTEDQINDVWKDMVSAEVRGLYFGDLASDYTRRKQLITGLSFFLSSGAAATLIARMPVWLPITSSVTVAILNAYAVAVNLDAKIRTMAKLHYAWKQIADDYRRLWSHTYSEAAASELTEIQRREWEFSQLATTDAPNEPKRMLRWTDQVFKLRHLEIA